MPWQQSVADVALEIDPETGGLWYRDVVVTVPRQSGKTTLLLPKFVWRAEASHLLGGRQRMLYTAQTGKDAIEKFDDDFVEDLAASRAMRGRYRVTNHQGRKRIRFRSGSLLMPVAPTSTAGHGKTLDDGTLDEAWAQRDHRVADAWAPAMVTRDHAQLWVLSTAGESQLGSPYLWSRVRRGRLLVEAGDPASRVAYFEYSAAAGSDPVSPATWWSCMPALGHTQSERSIAHALATIEGGVPAFCRAYLNLWPDTAAADREWVLPRANWNGACRDRASKRDRSKRPALAVDVTPDRAWSSVAYAAPRADGLPMGQVIRRQGGTEWAAAYVAAQARGRDACVVVIDGVGPVSSLKDAIEEELRGFCPVRVLAVGELADACAQLFDSVVTEQWRHTGQAELDAAVEGACERVLPGGRMAWDRRRSEVDISPLVAVTEASWGLAKYGGSGDFVF